MKKILLLLFILIYFNINSYAEDETSSTEPTVEPSAVDAPAIAETGSFKERLEA